MEDTEQDPVAEDSDSGAAAPTDQGSVGSADDLGEPYPLEESREDALDFIEGLLDAMDVDGEVSAEVTEEGDIAVEIEGADGGLLIGRHGQTLDALQELLRTAVQRKAQSRVRVMLDIEGYRVRRRVAIQEQARSAAERAIEENVEIELDPMSAYERKIVHDTVAEISGATSFSEGEEPRRRVVIRGAD